MSATADSLTFTISAKNDFSRPASEVRKEMVELSKAGKATAEGVRSAGSNVVELFRDLETEARSAVEQNQQVESAITKRTAAETKANQRRNNKIAGLREEVESERRLAEAIISGATAQAAIEAELRQEAAVRKLGAGATEEQRQAVRELTVELDRQKAIVAEARTAEQARVAAERQASVEATQKKARMESENSARERMISDLQLQADRQRRLSAAHAQGEDAVRRVNAQLAREEALRKLGAGATDKQRQSVIQLTDALHKQSAAQGTLGKQRGVQGISTVANALGGPLSGVSGQASMLSSMMGSVSLTTMAATTAIAGFAAAAIVSTREVLALERAVHKMEAAMKVSGNSAGLASYDLQDFAVAQARATRSTRHEIMEAASVLMTYKAVSGDTFKESISLAQDLSVALGSDLRGAIDTLGEVLASPERGLAALEKFIPDDIIVDKIRKLATDGKIEEARREILSQLSASVGGMASESLQGMDAATNSASEGWTNLKLAIGDFMEAGEKSEGFISSFGGVLDDFATAISFTGDRIRGSLKTSDEIENLGFQITQKMEELAELRRMTAEPWAVISPADIAKAEADLERLEEALRGAVRARVDSQKALERAANDTQVDRTMVKVRESMQQAIAATAEIGETAVQRIDRELKAELDRLDNIRTEIEDRSKADYQEEIAEIDRAKDAVNKLADAKRAAASISITNFSAGLSAELENVKRLADASKISLNAFAQAQREVAVSQRIAAMPAELQGDARDAEIAKIRQIDALNNEIAENTKKLQENERATSRSGSTAADTGDTIRENIESVRLQNEQMRLLADAYRQSTTAGEAMQRQLDAENAARALGKDATDAQREAIRSLTLEQIDLNKQLEETRRLAEEIPNLRAEGDHLRSQIDAYKQGTKEAVESALSAEEVRQKIRSSTVGLSESSASAIEAEIRANAGLEEQLKRVQEAYEFKQKLAEDIGSALTDAFSAAAFEGENLMDVLKNLALELSKIGLNTFFKPVANNLLSGALGGLGGAFGGGGGGMGAGYFPPAPGGGMSLGLYERGGPVQANVPIIVGEKRAEIFVPKTAGTVLPDAREELSKLTGGRSSNTIKVVNNFNGVKPQEVSQRSLAQMGASLGKVVNLGQKIR